MNSLWTGLNQQMRFSASIENSFARVLVRHTVGNAFVPDTIFLGTENSPFILDYTPDLSSLGIWTKMAVCGSQEESWLTKTHQADEVNFAVDHRNNVSQ